MSEVGMSIDLERMKQLRYEIAVIIDEPYTSENLVLATVGTFSLRQQEACNDETYLEITLDKKFAHYSDKLTDFCKRHNCRLVIGYLELSRRFNAAAHHIEDLLRTVVPDQYVSSDAMVIFRTSCDLDEEGRPVSLQAVFDRALTPEEELKIPNTVNIEGYYFVPLKLEIDGPE